jgi:hypothetical protein
VQLSDDEYQLVQVWFGASQWNGGSGGSGGPGDGGAGGPGGLGSGGGDLSRRFAPAEPSALPAPSHGSLPPLPEFEADREATQPQQPAKSPLRYSFLKHG